MKKLLALVLALVMSMALVVTSNADFKDANKISNKEAVEVMNAVGVLAGYEDGTFGASDELTRAQAAKIITYLDLGEKAAEALNGTGAYFTDVPATNWAAGYIEYCAQAGYVNGVGDGKFDPNGKLTGLQFAKMLLAVLGYDASVEKLVGSDWAINAAKLGAKADLYKGIDKASSAVLTREEAAQMAFNALQATMVEYDTKGTDITIGGGTSITVGASKADKVTKSGDKYSKIDDAKDGSNYYVELGEELYDGKLVKNESGAKDDLGRKAVKWTYKNDEVGTYGEAADVVYTLTDTYKKAVSTATMLTELQGEDFTDNEDLSFTKDKDGNVTTKIYVNGKTATDALITAAFDGSYKGGVQVELTYNDDDVNALDRVVILGYDIEKIDDVSTKITKSQKDDGNTCKVKVKGESYVLDTDLVGFDASTYVEDAYVCYIQDGTKILASQLATEVEGTVSSTKGDNKATIGGTTYKYVLAANSISVDDDGTFYLNVAGQIGAKDASSKSSDYIYIYNITEDKDTNSDGIEDVKTYKAYYVTADGVKGSADVATKEVEGKYYFKDYKSNSVEVTKSIKGVFAYSINSDKELLLKNPKDDISKDALTSAKVIDKNNAAGTDSSTKFVFVYQDGSKMKTSVATGYKNVKIAAGTSYYTVTNSDDDITLVFVAGTEDNAYASSALYAVLLDTKPTVTKNSSGDEVYTYSVSIDGEDTTLIFEEEIDSSLTKGSVFTYKMGSEYAKDVNDGSKEEVARLTPAKAGASTKDYVTLGDEQYNIGDGEKIYTVTIEYKKSAKIDVDADSFNPNNADTIDEIDTVTVAEGGSIDKDDYVAYGLDGSDLDVVFVFDYVG